MATLAELCEAGALVRIRGGLEPGEQPMRILLAFPHVIKWLHETLPQLVSELDEAQQTPIEQADDLFYMYVSGEEMSFYERSHSMLPHDDGVWEFKTPDLRFIGWFVKHSCFIIAEVDTAAACKSGLYSGYKNMAIYRRKRLDLDEPKFITGDYANVL